MLQDTKFLYRILKLSAVPSGPPAHQKKKLFLPKELSNEFIEHVFRKLSQLRFITKLRGRGLIFETPCIRFLLV